MFHHHYLLNACISVPVWLYYGFPVMISHWLNCFSVDKTGREDYTRPSSTCSDSRQQSGNIYVLCESLKKHCLTSRVWNTVVGKSGQCISALKNAASQCKGFLNASCVAWNLLPGRYFSPSNHPLPNLHTLNYHHKFIIAVEWCPFWWCHCVSTIESSHSTNKSKYELVHCPCC